MQKQKLTIADEVLEKIRSDRIAMRPRWHFIGGSILLIAGIAGSFTVSVFLVSLIVFSLRTHGPMGAVRWEQLVSTFPWWAIPVAVFGIYGGIALLKRYDFSYRKNFGTIILAVAVSVILSGYLINATGIDAWWAGRGPFDTLYRRYDGSGQGGGHGRGYMRGR